MAEQFLIEDGYTIDGKIDRRPGIHPELRFTYRPALADQRNRYLKAAQEFDKRAQCAADLIVRHVTAWGVNEAKPTVAVVLKLQPALMDSLVDIITGYAPSGEEAADEKN